MPVLCDRGGVHKLQAAFATAELARKAKLEKMQAAWCAREADIDARLKDANDVLARTLPADREAAQMSDQLEEARRTAKRKHDAEVEEQRVHNRDIKGKVRKKFKAALAVTAARDSIAERAKATAKAAIASVLAAYKDKAAV
ncbi:Hypothetical protein EMIHUDRAFT_228146 [Emiliania huxleyi CCMP1516]|uniref:Uncharacterized protein n=2 Tax=Emiliania huxleyi TaxID=2903 RepID=A0A0D3KGH7_EMIH1|nr:Hypothetical protein EMIHUDRAFT_228146 [Emiliania huxleyi CCMP1516]EOD34862.1 Hypothetical protein EMIHUDRAFT_228146 [Emiliania huxleyi CCMP1516]|eukprot:XP_005787291.1 Hypothetical protein EMIHUDRAFT_228146 [Emiliania huxleyi CCMP1516]